MPPIQDLCDFGPGDRISLGSEDCAVEVIVVTSHGTAIAFTLPIGQSAFLVVGSEHVTIYVEQTQSAEAGAFNDEGLAASHLRGGRPRSGRGYVAQQRRQADQAKSEASMAYPPWLSPRVAGEVGVAMKQFIFPASRSTLPPRPPPRSRPASLRQRPHRRLRRQADAQRWPR